MKKSIIKLSVLFLSFSILTACSQSRFMDLSGFIYNFNRVSDEDIDFEDVYSYEDEGDGVFEVFIEDDTPTVVMKLVADNDRIKQIRIAVAKRGRSGENTVPSLEAIEDFTETVEGAIRAYCSFDKDKAEALMNEFSLYNKETYMKQGELSKNQENFSFTYYSDSLVCDMIISDNYLLKTEKTEKPESNPAFGNTTNIRGETTPLPSFKSGG